jgi:hypothetical protein
MPLLPDTAYFVESSEDSSVMLALDAKLHDGLVEWFDTSRDRAFEVKSFEDLPDGLRVVTERASYQLRRLTIEIYEAHVRDQVTGHRPFSSTEAVQEFYRHFPR